MNRWAAILAATPPTLQRLIVRHQRISLPRGAPPDVRLDRLRRALCHAATVRATYFALDPSFQAALQALRAHRGAISPATLARRYGPIRPWAQMAADPRPQSCSEQLILLGWLLPRPATDARHPAHYLLAPEVRRWLPQPLQLPDLGEAPPPALPPPALHAAAVILLATAEHPLPLRRDGTFSHAALRRLVPRLAMLDAADAARVCRFVAPLLSDLGLLAPHGPAAALAPAGARFLRLPAPVQLARLRAAWITAPRPDGWLHPLLPDQRGIDWPLLRRRLEAWAAALPQGRLLDPSGLYAALAAALGPLADAQTHGFRTVDRTPWQRQRAAAVWTAALRGPLTWLGQVVWAGECCAAIPTRDDQLPHPGAPPPLDVPAVAAPPAWRYGAPGEVIVPHTALDADVLRLLPAASWHTADTTATVYRLTRQQIATATRDGHTSRALRMLLEHRAGPLPDAWHPLFKDLPAPVRILHTAVVISDSPALLTQAAQQRTVRRYLTPLAPGIALADPARAPALARALARQDLSVDLRGSPAVTPPATLTPAECATLLAACATYRRHAPDGALPAVTALEARLRAALPPALADPAPIAPPAQPDAAPGIPALAPRWFRALGLITALWHMVWARLCAWRPRPGSTTPPAGGLAGTSVAWAAALPVLRQAIMRRQLVCIRYTAWDALAPTERTIRPLRLENHGDRWYVHAYCTLAQAERCFRLDRIMGLAIVAARPHCTVPAGRRSAPRAGQAPRPRRSAPRAGFFPTPPDPPSGSPLVRIWLAG